MPRLKSPAVLTRILDATSATVLERGYHGTRMLDVAKRARVSAGTLYLYAETKAALFELTLRRSFGDPLPDPATLPVPTTSNLVEFVWARLQAAATFPVLRAAAARSHPEPADDPNAELEAVIRELWGWVAAHWEALELIERCAAEWPELHAFFYADFRERFFELATKYLNERMRGGYLRQLPDPTVAMRVISENVAFFAMHRRIRPYSRHLDEAHCRETVVQVLVRGFSR